MTKKSVEKVDKKSKKINIQKQNLTKTPENKVKINKKIETKELNKKIESKLEIKNIKLQNVGPFDELGLTINFGKKLDTKKANIHIFVGENGSGKSTILKKYYSDKVCTIENTPNLSRSVKYKEFDKEIDCPIYLYLINEDRQAYTNQRYNYSIDYELEDTWQMRISLNLAIVVFQENINLSSYLEYTARVWADRREVQLYEYEKKDNKTHSIPYLEYLELKKKASIIENIENIISKIYDIKFNFTYNNGKYTTFINNKQVDYHNYSMGYKKLIGFLSNLLINLHMATFETGESFNFVDKDNFCNARFTLLLDEIDIHLHPKAQRRILPALQTLFPNAEIFCTTHSPFVVNSVSDAWVYKLNQKHGIIEPISSNNYYGKPIEEALDEEFDISYNDLFDINTQEKLDNFKIQVKDFYKKPTQANLEKIKKEFKPMMKISREVAEIINFNFEKMYEKIL